MWFNKGCPEAAEPDFIIMQRAVQFLKAQLLKKGVCGLVSGLGVPCSLCSRNSSCAF
jgi:hypothetical protein